VAQIARSMARTLALDEDLTEAVALAHDLGHPPFGHAGERALDRAMQGAGGFDHNAQSLRVVTRLERKYAEFDGLNLSWETLEGLVKHNGPLTHRSKIPAPILAYNAKHDLELESFASAEAQLAALADDIAYNNHDIDDGFRFGCFRFEELREIPMAGRVLDDLRCQYPGLDNARVLNELNRRLITAMIDDAIAETARRLASLAPKDATALRHAPCAVTGFSAAMIGEMQVLREFLTERVYRHPRVLAVMDQAQAVIGDLFDLYDRRPDALPPNWSDQAPEGDRAYARHICDFIAGMTDRYALAEHRRLFDATPDLR
jgi:dGTPase